MMLSNGVRIPLRLEKEEENRENKHKKYLCQGLFCGMERFSSEMGLHLGDE
jgi:hypothetical protein